MSMSFDNKISLTLIGIKMMPTILGEATGPLLEFFIVIFAHWRSFPGGRCRLSEIRSLRPGDEVIYPKFGFAAH